MAQRYDDVLVVNFTDTNGQPRSAVEGALRAAQAQEQAALAKAEAKRQQAFEVLRQLPVAVALVEGPTHPLKFFNELYGNWQTGRFSSGSPPRPSFPNSPASTSLRC